MKTKLTKGDRVYYVTDCNGLGDIWYEEWFVHSAGARIVRLVDLRGMARIAYGTGHVSMALANLLVPQDGSGGAYTATIVPADAVDAVGRDAYMLRIAEETRAWRLAYFDRLAADNTASESYRKLQAERATTIRTTPPRFEKHVRFRVA